MFSVRRSTLAVVTALAMTSFSVLALAEDDGAVGLRYDADPSCPGRSTFEAAVTSHTARARFADAGASRARAFHVRVERRGAGRVVGHIEGTDAHRSRTDRAIAGTSCEEVVSALALVTALAIDPGASTAPAAQSDLAPGEESPAITPPGPAAAPSSTGAARPAPIADGADRPAALATSSPSRRPTRRAVRASAASMAAFGLSPLPALGVELRARLEADHGGPSVAIGAAFLSSSLLEGDPDASFRYFTGDLEVCPAGLRLSPAIAARACAQLAGGIVQARGLDTPNPEEHSGAWVDARALSRLSVSRGRFDLELHGGALAPITRPTFVFQAPRTLVHHTPAMAAFVGIGGGVRF